MTTATVHCQICGRAIKAARGRIALHGYTRPGQGWQTASCPGARQLPYEVSCNRIADTIADCQRWIDSTQAALDRDMATPPAQLVQAQRRYGRLTGASITLERPEDFDPHARRTSYRVEPTYGECFDGIQQNRRQGIQATQQTITFLQERLAAWSPVPTLQAYWRDVLGYRLEGSPQLQRALDAVAAHRE